MCSLTHGCSEGLELPFTSWQVDQAELEAYDGVAAGKYTIGLGQASAPCCNTGFPTFLHQWPPVTQQNIWVTDLLQKRMAFYNDQENVASAAMTVVQNLMDKYEIDPRSIGRYKGLSILCHVCSASSACSQSEHISDSKRCYFTAVAALQTGGWYRKRYR